MNDRNRGGMTVSSLLLTGLIASVAIPIVLIVALGWLVANGINSSIFVYIAGLCALIVLGGVLTVNYIVRRRIQDRLLGLVDVCRNFAGGDHSIRAVVNGDDEFAMLAMSLNTLLDSQNFSGNGSVMNANGSDAAALQAQIEKLLQEVSAVGDGDLRVQAEVTPDTLGVLADSFNYMIEELAKVVGRVQSTAVQVTNATRRILDRSAELAQASETQVGQISQTSQSVEELATFVLDVAHNAQLSAESAQDALQNAHSGQEAVRQTINGMILIRENVQDTAKKIKRLGERSNEIGEIVRIIEDIADQTNLLALNAAIQSAMAGEHGRGFAVVADEIRLLAERSTESTKRIATLVKSIQGDTFEAVVAMEDSTQEVVKGSQLADEAGQALNSIYGAVERQAQTIEAIAQAANEQASVSENVAIAMNRISEITSQTNAGAQETAMSVSYLAELADQLRASVATFRLPDRSNEADAFPGMTGVPALPNASEDSGFQQDMSLQGDWNSGFSSEFLSLPQPQEMGNSGSFQFTFGQQDFNSQPSYASVAGGAPQFTHNQQGFNGQGFNGQPDFDLPALNNGNVPGFGNQPNYGDMGAFDGPAQRGFDGQAFGTVPESGYGSANQTVFPMQGQSPAAPQNNFGVPQQGQPSPARPRWRNGQPGQSAYGQDQMPFPNNS